MKNIELIIKRIYIFVLQANELVMFRSVFIFVFCLSSIYSQTPPPPAQIEAELSSARKEFEAAQKLFNPWYSGPLLTGSGNTFPPHKIGVQPYLYVVDNYGKFNQSGHSSSIDNLIVVNPLIQVLTGLTEYTEIALDSGWIYQQKNGIHGNGPGDTGLRLGISLSKETYAVPAVKLNIKEFFPTGRYENLDPNAGGVDATGNGSFRTLLGIAASKLLVFDVEHPMSVRGSLNYIIPSNVSVSGVNNYGGAFDTEGIVTPGKAISAAFAFEYSFNQNWVFANDFLYTYRDQHRFKGNPGTNPDGSVASVGSAFSDQLSLSPAIEYDPGPNLNFIAGAWFSVWGRNSLNFAGAIVSVYFSF
jgi:hypothetical protein